MSESKTLYCDAIGGASGNMFLGALLHAGAKKENLEKAIESLNPPPFQIIVEEVQKIGITAFHVHVEVEEHHHHRGLLKILEIIQGGSFSENVKTKAETVFRKLAEAEGTVHNADPEKMHFHEVGQWDAIIDITGTIFCMEQLGIEKVFSSPLPLGTGITHSAHGPLPLPSPATTHILKDIPTILTGIESELVTPTGAALIAGLSEGFTNPPEMKIEKIGYGAGSRDLKERPNLLRIFIGHSEETPSHQMEEISVLKTNIDDQSPELFEFLMERLLEEGALDVTFTPITMKKNRPAITVTALSPIGKEQSLIDILFKESNTFGVRIQRVNRAVAPNEKITVQTPWGPVQGRIKLGEHSTFSPEYDECKTIAKENNIPLIKVYEEAVKASER